MVARKFARYGPRDRYEAPPGGGFCLSVFALIERGDKFVAGQAARNKRWLSDWSPQWAVYPKAEAEAPYTWTLLPATYMREGEHPDDALDRVLRQQVRVRSYKVEGVGIVSTVAKSDWYKGAPHWDLAFVYRVKAALPKAKPGPWWKELGWVRKGSLDAKAFGWNHDLAQDLGLAR